MTELQELMRQNVSDPPYDDFEPAVLVSAGRRRRHVRRLRVAGLASVAVGAVAVVAVAGPGTSTGTEPAGPPPAPAAPTLHLSDATPGVAGRDYRVLASYTNDNLDRDNGQYFDGVTDDGMILFRDGPRADRLFPRLALLDPTTGAKDWLPDPHLGQQQTEPVELGTRRLVLVGQDGTSDSGALVAHVFDRDTRQWSEVTWPGLPDISYTGNAVMGPDQRLYVSVPATQGQPPEGGWPTGPGGEADDAGAQGDTYHLWSVSLTDPSDVRDEHVSVGSVAFTPTSRVWTDSTNGASGLVHVRDLATGEEHSFDPGMGARCNLLSFTATAQRIVMGEYCGTFGNGVRDDRVQVVSTDGQQVVTIQDSGIGGAIRGLAGDNGIITITAYEHGKAGTYAYDLTTARFLRLSDTMDTWSFGGPAPAGELMWTTPVNNGHGTDQVLAKLLP